MLPGKCNDFPSHFPRPTKIEARTLSLCCEDGGLNLTSQTKIEGTSQGTGVWGAHLLVEFGKGVFALLCRPRVAALVLVALHPVLQPKAVCPCWVGEGLPPPGHLPASASFQQQDASQGRGAQSPIRLRTCMPGTLRPVSEEDGAVYALSQGKRQMIGMAG